MLPLWQGAEDRGGPGSASRRGRPVPGLPQRQENAGFAAVVARGGGPGCPGSASRRGRSVPGLPQRQENAGFAAVVARGGGPGCPEKCLSQGSASSGASATAGKCGFRCRCGKGRRTGQVGQAEAGLRSLPDDAAVEHADDAVGLLGLGLVVGHHQDGLAALLVDLVQELHNLGTHLRVQVTGGLVR